MRLAGPTLGPHPALEGNSLRFHSPGCCHKPLSFSQPPIVKIIKTFTAEQKLGPSMRMEVDMKQILRAEILTQLYACRPIKRVISTTVSNRDKTVMAGEDILLHQTRVEKMVASKCERRHAQYAKSFAKKTESRCNHERQARRASNSKSKD